MMTFAKAAEAQNLATKLADAKRELQWLWQGSLAIHIAVRVSPNAPPVFATSTQYLVLENYPHWREGLMDMMREIVKARIDSLSEEITKLGFEAPQ